MLYNKAAANGSYSWKQEDHQHQFLYTQASYKDLGAILSRRNTSVGRCVIPCAFLVKVSNIHFLVEKCILLKKKDVYNFFLAF